MVQCLLKVFDLCYISPHLLIKSDGCVLLTNTDACFVIVKRWHARACTCELFSPICSCSIQENHSYFLIRWIRWVRAAHSPLDALQRNAPLAGAQIRWTLTYGPPPHPTPACQSHANNRTLMDADLLRKRKSKGVNHVFHPHQRKYKYFMSVMVRWEWYLLISYSLHWHCFKCNFSRC